MADSAETVFFTDLVLDIFQTFRIKFYDLAAGAAYHMVVVAVPEAVLIEIALVRPHDLFDKAAFDEEV
jgi:hypothetical protein